VKEAFLSLIEEERAVIYVLMDGGNLISYQIGFTHDRTFYFWNTSFNMDYYKYSPGRIITGHILEDLIRRSYKAGHFMRGDHEYKREWMHKDREHFSNNYLFMFPKKNVKGKILEKYYLDWRDEIKKRFRMIISNRHFISMLRLNRQ
jgi:CelD/BcsL family acetyltransferase involved in cellulose biosynthesis